ncbi:hypothetical protein [Nocardia tengchongensis]|uniref:hypothetical protein n=1 Tax=Nocardia tengchongensis TaxID=2055889 RepID=UPI0036B41506
MTTIATLAVAGGTVGALYFTNKSLQATTNQNRFSQQTAITDRFRLAAEQVASEKINVRISGIYLLEHLAKDSPTENATVYAILAAFVRTQTSSAGCPSPPAGSLADIATVRSRETCEL